MQNPQTGKLVKVFTNVESKVKKHSEEVIEALKVRAYVRKGCLLVASEKECGKWGLSSPDLLCLPCPHPLPFIHSQALQG